MKRRLEEPAKPLDASGGYPLTSSPLSPLPIRLPPRTLTPVVNQPTYAPAIKPTSDLRAVQGFSTFTTTMPAVTPAIKSVVMGGLQGGAQTLTSIHTLQPTHTPMRHKVHGGAITPPVSSNSTSASQQQIQRLKVEDALSYLDMVKFKFGDQPQVYNDFLDIMKEFKSQSIDTPGVIDRVSNLFNGHPELIVGFNTFLPPGYKIEVKTSDQGYSFQVQVSMPSPSAATTTMVPAAPIVHHTTQLPTVPISVPTTVVTKPLLLTGTTTIVSHVNTAAAVVPPPPPVPATTPPHFSTHTLTPSITQVQAHQAVSQALSHVENTPPPTPQSQPVEFNHAINYVNKIKNRFQGQPDKYKRFLEILHTYQKEQRNLKEGVGSGAQALGTKQLTEAEVYSQVAKLFEHQEDLLAEFGQFLPDATNHQTQLTRRCEEPSSITRKPAMNVKMSSFVNNTVVSPSPSPVSVSGTSGPVKICTMNTGGTHPASATTTLLEAAAPQSLKRSPSMTPHHSSPSTSTTQHPPPTKKQKLSTSFRDVSFSEAAKYGTLTDFAFFDKVRKALRTQDVYENFLRCVNLYIIEVVNRCELMQLITPFLNRFPELFRWFREYIGHTEAQQAHLPMGPNSPPHNSMSCESMMNSISRPGGGGDQSEIDFASCKRLGASYCALPRNHPEEKCSGRTTLCQKVLNDTWVSFPTWSEESTFVTSRKTQYEEYIYRCEDERFELDMVLEVNAAAIRVLETLYKKLTLMSPDEVAKFRLDEYLSVVSPTICHRAMTRIYGDKASDIIDGMKKCPLNSTSIIMKRLKSKEEEWREAQKAFNKAWREQNDKYYLKSLDHQGINFKQNDMKALRSKSLFNEIETCCDERHEQAEASGMVIQGPHMTLSYRDKSVLDDAANLLIHHTKRQTSIHKEDKQRIKHMLRQFLPDLFHHPRQELSEDERDVSDDKGPNPDSPNTDSGSNSKSKPEDKNKDDNKEDDKLPIHAMSSHPKRRVSSNEDKRKNSNRLEMKKIENFLKDKAATRNHFLSVMKKIIENVENKRKRRQEKSKDISPPEPTNKEMDEAYTLFFGNGNWYLFFRLHQILCDRLTLIYEQANIMTQEEIKAREKKKDSVSSSLRLKPKCEYLVDVKVEDYYSVFLDMVKSVLDGNMDSNNYEDTLREMFGIHAYHAFTLDKVVTYAVRQLQHLVSDDACTECVDLYQKYQRSGGTGGPCSTAHQRANNEAAYQRKAELVLVDENCFKMFIYKVDCKFTIELLDNDADDNDTTNHSETEKWAAYVDRYAKPSKDKDETMDLDEDMDPEQERRMWGKAIFLPRNVRLWHDRVGHNSENAQKIDSCDETECKFSLNSYKMVFVLDRESYLYKRQALHRAKKSHKALSERMRGKFHDWHQTWADNHLSQQQIEFAGEWMLGNLPDYRSNQTVVLTDNPLDKPPYHPFNRYRVDYK